MQSPSPDCTGDGVEADIELQTKEKHARPLDRSDTLAVTKPDGSKSRSTALTAKSDLLCVNNLLREEEPSEILERFKLRCLQMSWQIFENTVASGNHKFDLLITDPPDLVKKSSSKTGGSSVQ